MSLFKRANAITPELVAQAFLELRQGIDTVLTIHTETFNVHATAINTHEARMLELEKAVSSLLAERVE